MMILNAAALQVAASQALASQAAAVTPAISPFTRSGSATPDIPHCMEPLLTARSGQTEKLFLPDCSQAQKMWTWTMTLCILVFCNWILTWIYAARHGSLMAKTNNAA